MGAVGCCRPWVPGLGELSKPLTEATKVEDVEPLQWGPEREKAFQTIKGTLASAPALGLPDFSKSFELFVHENRGAAGGVLTQKLVPHRHPVAYYSTQLDLGAAGNNSCVTAIAAAVTIVESSRPSALGHPATVCVPHGVEVILKQHAAQASSPQSAHRYESMILNVENITLKRCNVLSPATSLAVPSNDQTHHDCAKVVFHSAAYGTICRINLQKTQI